MRWRTKAGDEISASLGAPTKDMIGQAWRTALDPEGEWIPAVLGSPIPACLRCGAVFRMPAGW